MIKVQSSKFLNLGDPKSNHNDASISLGTNKINIQKSLKKNVQKKDADDKINITKNTRSKNFIKSWKNDAIKEIEFWVRSE